MKNIRKFAVAALALGVMAGCDDEEQIVDIDPNAPVEVTFDYTPPADAPEITSINVAGSFAEEGEPEFWNPELNPMTESGGVWTLTKELVPGTYQYKFVFNGEWPGDMCNDQTWGHADEGYKIDPPADCSEEDFGNAILVVE